MKFPTYYLAMPQIALKKMWCLWRCALKLHFFNSDFDFWLIARNLMINKIQLNYDCHHYSFLPKYCKFLNILYVLKIALCLQILLQLLFLDVFIAIAISY